LGWPNKRHLFAYWGEGGKDMLIDNPDKETTMQGEGAALLTLSGLLN
jgi:hypothetical protein